MKIIFILIFTFLISNSAYSANCKLDTSKSFFKDLVGEPYGDPGTPGYRINFEKREVFTPDPPMKASFNFPFTGNCEDLIVFKIEIYRALGPDTFEDNGDHKGHDGSMNGIHFEKKPIFSGKKELVLSKNIAEIKTFEIAKMMEKAPKDHHIWRFKFVFKYQTSAGLTQTFEKLINSPLSH